MTLSCWAQAVSELLYCPRHLTSSNIPHVCGELSQGLTTPCSPWPLLIANLVQAHTKLPIPGPAAPAQSTAVSQLNTNTQSSRWPLAPHGAPLPGSTPSASQDVEVILGSLNSP